MRYRIEFDADRLSGARFGVLIDHLAREVAQSESHDVTVTAQRAGDVFAATAVPVVSRAHVVHSTAPAPTRPATRDELVGALLRYYTTE
jgi:hypothetical protein